MNFRYTSGLLSIALLVSPSVGAIGLSTFNPYNWVGGGAKVAPVAEVVEASVGRVELAKNAAISFGGAVRNGFAQHPYVAAGVVVGAGAAALDHKYGKQVVSKTVGAGKAVAGYAAGIVVDGYVTVSDYASKYPRVATAVKVGLAGTTALALVVADQKLVYNWTGRGAAQLLAGAKALGAVEYRALPGKALDSAKQLGGSVAALRNNGKAQLAGVAAASVIVVKGAEWTVSEKKQLSGLDAYVQELAQTRLNKEQLEQAEKKASALVPGWKKLHRKDAVLNQAVTDFIAALSAGNAQAISENGKAVRERIALIK